MSIFKLYTEEEKRQRELIKSPLTPMPFNWTTPGIVNAPMTYQTDLEGFIWEISLDGTKRKVSDKQFSGVSDILDFIREGLPPIKKKP